MVSDNLSISEFLKNLVNSYLDQELVTLDEINHNLGARGFPLLLILFSFPMAIPLPYPPGFTTILGIPLLIFSMQMCLGKSIPIMPKWLGAKNIKTVHLKFAVEKTIKYFIYIEKFLHPRLLSCTNKFSERVIGAVCLLCSISIVLPIIFGNALPSAGILIMALGLLEKDGITIIIGIIVSIIGLIVSGLVVYTIFYGAKLAANSFLKDFYHWISK